MAYCPDCGIEITTKRENCPLCSAKLQSNEPSFESPFPVDIRPVAPDPLGWVGIRKILFGTLSLMLALGFVSVLMVNLMQDGTLNWARYAIVCIATGWAVLGMGLYLYPRPIAFLWRATGIIALSLVLLDAFSENNVSWSIGLALPIILLAASLASWLWWVFRVRCSHWASGNAAILVAIALFCLGVNFLVSLYFQESLLPTWAAIVCLSLGPPFLFLIYVRYRLSKAVDLPKMFHR